MVVFESSSLPFQVSMLRSTVSVGRSVKWNEINFDILSSFFVCTTANSKPKPNPNPNSIPPIYQIHNPQPFPSQTHLSQNKKKQTKIPAFSGNVPKTESEASYFFLKKLSSLFLWSDLFRCLLYNAGQGKLWTTKYQLSNYNHTPFI